MKNVKNGFDRPVDRSVELGFRLCFQQNGYPPVGSWLGNAGRGTQKDRVIGTSVDQVIGKTQIGTEAA